MSDRVPALAAFDVDGTLTVRDCVRPFLERVGGRPRIAWAIVRRPFASFVALARRDRDAVKEIVVGGVLRGRRVDDVDRIGAAFAAEVHPGWLRPDTLARLRWHQQRGDTTVLVSASLGPYLRPLAGLLGIDAVLCTDVHTVSGSDGEATYGDRLVDGNCRAAEKARRLDAWRAEHGLSGATLWAYGDSRGDREMLDGADHAVWVKDVVVAAVPEGAT